MGRDRLPHCEGRLKSRRCLEWEGDTAQDYQRIILCRQACQCQISLSTVPGPTYYCSTLALIGGLQYQGPGGCPAPGPGPLPVYASE